MILFTAARSDLRPGLVLALAVAFAVSIAAGCGDDSPRHSPGSAPTSNAGGSPSGSRSSIVGAPSGKRDACALLTREDAAAALGAAVGDPTPNAGASSGTTTISNCTATTTASPAKSASVLLRVATPLESSTVYNATRSGAPGAVEVPGVGEKAFYNPQYGQIAILERDAYILVAAGTFPNPPAQPPEALTTFAKAVAERY